MTKQQITLQIDGMVCNGCASVVHDKLMAVPGVQDVDVSLEDGRADVRAEEKVSAEQLTAALADTDYSARPLDDASAEEEGPPAASVETDTGSDSEDEKPKEEQPPKGDLVFDVEGMSCASCVATVEKALSNVEGVEAARVNFAMERAAVELGPDADREDVTRLAEEAVSAAGYKATAREKGGGAPQDDSREKRSRETRKWFRAWVAGAILTAPVMFLEMIAPRMEWTIPGSAIITFVLTTFVMAWAGRYFFEGAWKGLRHSQVNMEIGRASCRERVYCEV